MTDGNQAGASAGSAATNGGLTRRDGSSAGARLRVAIVGGGFMAEVHSRAARAARADIAGIVSSTPERSAAAAERLGIGRSYGSLDDLLADDTVDLVHVTTPNALHAEQAAAVLAAGKDVICEKPLATSAADAESLVAAAEGRTATVPFVYRFHPLVREARARFASGEAGRVLSINASYLQDWLLGSDDDNWRVDAAQGGRSRAFADIGSHLVDLVEFVSGDRVSRVSATKRTVFAERASHAAITTEDAVAVVIETRSGALGTLLVSQVAPGRKNHLWLEISGSAESVAFDQEQPETLWVGRRKGSLIIPRDADQLSEDAARLCVVPSGHPQGYQDAFNAFVADSYAAVAGENPDGLPRFTDGLRAVRITDAVIDSAESGTWIEMGTNND
ncbi:Predicted dehydrogenase [Leifsonia sp. 98AMF]|uniref:Gfo/Idh/MocA family protein n=1 Tax=unclassified Leifsonia TaxID=2663824 RepID=UPI00087BBDD6|nr:MULTISPECIES: Gfo/Idh/MocA family oxidoreductase [unclassified Leifsonia]SDH12143.1 Predicted dehydrogenase [Leifsonia sp. 197AMF]SDJ26566.1 Predicted dehydrogenase [Leifsonia sp. 466MF]SDK55429.1 Predicted dehydrogenase [Leifsonia sp. 157MF]SDN48541.1 Predicted dehydrogenase [Leifsonia sp. 509MF]SEN62144.1 Predicted dehydrogenase [Leifsonia sp. 467MF]